MKSDDTNVTDRITRRYRRQPGQLVAAAGAARADRKVVADRLAAAVGEDRWTVDKARTFLLVAAGGEPPDETALWEHAAKDRGVTVADGIRRVQRGANLDDGAGLAGEVSADAPGKRVFRGVACSPKAKPAPSGTAGNTVEQCRLKPLQRKALRSTKRVEVGKSKRKSRFNAWTTYAIRPFYCNRILEIGSGLGNITRILS